MLGIMIGIGISLHRGMLGFDVLVCYAHFMVCLVESCKLQIMELVSRETHTELLFSLPKNTSYAFVIVKKKKKVDLDGIL